MDSELTKYRFFDLGVQYYVAGRFLFLKYPSWDVGCNLLHHAIEMLMKGILSKYLPLDEMKQRKLGHKLPNLWKAAKRNCGNSSLAPFDQIITKLNRFESIRYPDAILRGGGAVFSVAINSGEEIQPMWNNTRPESKYQIALEDVDRLFQFLFALGDANPVIYENRMSEDAIGIVREQNKFCFL